MEAEIGMWIDGREKCPRVRLADGIKAGERKTPICSCRTSKGTTA
jgi:hypothetical protein